MICRKINHPFVQAVFQAAEKLGMPILFHMSPQEGYEYGIVDEPGLPMLEEALEKYPGLKFIGHSQPFWHEISQDAKPDLKSRMEWGRGPVREGGRLVCLMRNYKNLYADLSANSGGCAIMRDEKFGLQFLEEFQEREGTLVGFCVLGGIFSEGVDLTGESLIGAVIVGTGLPQIGSQREILKEYYDKKNHCGFDYAYRYPGMNKVLQAAWRLIRTKEDKE